MSLRSFTVFLIAGLLSLALTLFFIKFPTDPGESEPSPSPNFASIEQALKDSLSLGCDFATGPGETRAYIKNGALRIDLLAPSPTATSSLLVRDQTLFYWNSQGGFIAALDNSSASANLKVKDSLESLEKNRHSCYSSIIADQVFYPPINLDYQDFYSLTESSQSSPAAPLLE